MKDRFNRQSFLGAGCQMNFEEIRIAVIGYGGGGSHIGQQLWHIGFKNVVIFDDDVAELTNVNRLIGISYPDDIDNKTSKVDIAQRVHRQITGDKDLEVYKCRWQERADVLKKCHIVIGCVDSYCERDQLERICRQFMIPLVDIGLDVSIVEDEAPQMAGQVILSMPGFPCMRCLGFLSDEKVAKERSDYGDAGPLSQVVWANGDLASKAVGIVVDLISDWTKALRGPVYLSYNGNTGETHKHIRLEYSLDKTCSHYKPNELGVPRMKSI